jgi:hypothetical protein
MGRPRPDPGRGPPKAGGTLSGVPGLRAACRGADASGVRRTLVAAALVVGVLAVCVPAAADPVPGGPPEGSYLIARVKPGAVVKLRATPGGRLLKRVGRRTQFGSLRVFTVFRRHGRWLGVAAPEVPNGRLGWIHERSGLYFTRTAYSLHADLSRRELELWDGDTVIRRITVGIGGWPSTTPIGSFAVTDKLKGRRYGRYYGCCILAISGTQPNLPRGWVGGNRLAIHGTDRPSTIGQAASAGCLRANRQSLLHLMARVPLGTPVFIHP